MPEHAEKPALVLRINLPGVGVFGVVRRGHKK
jgi:hypothetical protein